MKSIIVQGKSANEIIEIVHEMQRHGWVINLDFDWEYHRPDYYGFYNNYTVFKFYKEEHSTYFALRWL